MRKTRKGRKGRKHQRPRAWLIGVAALIVLLLLLIAVLAWNIWQARKLSSLADRQGAVVLQYTPPPSAPEPVATKPEPIAKPLPKPHEKAIPQQPVSSRVSSGLSLIMDDMGYDVRAARRLLDLGVPLAISVLPNAPHAARVARLAHEAGQVVMLHLPMEPEGAVYRQRMDASFLTSAMNQQSMRQVMQWDVQHVPFVQGVNNHMGSRLSSNRQAMQWVMQWCREQGLFFVDSLTSPHSVAASVARQYALRWGKRRIFLDDKMTIEAMQRSWQRVQSCMHKQRRCIVIAHPHASSIAFLQQHVGELKAWKMYPVTALLQ